MDTASVLTKNRWYFTINITIFLTFILKMTRLQRARYTSPFILLPRGFVGSQPHYVCLIIV